MKLLGNIVLTSVLCSGWAFAGPVAAHDVLPPAPPPQASATPAQLAVLFRNVRVFDGVSGRTSAAQDVLVRGNRIERIAPGIATGPDTRVIEGAGRVLMPGLIDAHWHSMLVGPTVAQLMTADQRYLSMLAGVEAGRTLMRGFTTVRDVGGNVFGLKQATDSGLLPGPRVYPSGAMITVTSGHGDFRSADELPRTLGTPARIGDPTGDSAIADSPDEVRTRVREQLMRGASQIKLTAGGGVSSPHSPLDAVTFTPAELRAATEAAGNWGTYVTVHAYTPEAVRQAIAAGVKVIEHGSLLDD